jgi:hypothetical protein
VVIERAMTGRLLPRQVCAQIVSATRAPQSLSIVHIEPGRRGVPVNETDALTAVFSWLAR